MYDERWPVRDAACLASGKLLKIYHLNEKNVPIEGIIFNQEEVPSLEIYFEAWLKGLHDCLLSMRENVSIAISEVLNYELQQQDQNNKSLYIKIIDWIHNILEKEFLVSTGDLINKPKNNAIKNFLPDIMLEKYQNKSDNNENKNYNISASFYKKKVWDCCIDCVEVREARPWEVSQGLIDLIKRISPIAPTIWNTSFKFIINKNENKENIKELKLIDALHEILYKEDYISYEKLQISVIDQVSIILFSIIFYILIF